MVDRRMKRIDGLKFCESVRKANLLIRLLLFTGYTTKEEAVKAFNQRIIDGFLVKEGDPGDAAEEINFRIHENMRQQFVDLGQTLTGLLSHVLRPLHNPSFVSVFDSCKKAHDAVEFYLLDSSCSYLLINAQGQVKQLFVRNESDFDCCYEIAQDSGVSPTILSALEKREQFPYTKDLMGYAKLQGDHWEKALITVNRIENQELYYAVVERPDVTVFSFERYLKEKFTP